MGRIAVEGMKFYAYHGYYLREQKVGSFFLADVYLETMLTEAASADDLDKTINYEEVYAITSEHMGHRSKLIEHVAAEIRKAIMARFPQASAVKVRISKLQPPLKGEVQRVFVEIG